MTKDSQIKNFLVGACAGSLAVAFNPWDQALYRMMLTRTPLFSYTNDRYVHWQNPWRGSRHALAHRIISYGMYFPLIDFYKNQTLKTYNLTSNQISLIASTLTGVTTAIMLNPINVVKTQNWNKDTTNVRQSIFQLIKSSCKENGKYSLGKISQLGRGLQYTIGRDVLFGTIYTLGNDNYNLKKDPFIDISFACLATIINSPMNYIRHQKLFAPLNQPPPTISQIYTNLLENINKCQKNKCTYLFVHNMGLGWGTLRVGVGMMSSRLIYDYLKDKL